MSETNTEATSAANLIGVIALTTFGWRQVAVTQTKEEAEQIAARVRNSGQYLDVKFN